MAKKKKKLNFYSTNPDIEWDDDENDFDTNKVVRMRNQSKTININMIKDDIQDSGISSPKSIDEYNTDQVYKGSGVNSPYV